MAITLALDGLQSGITGEERAIALLKVTMDGASYDWSIYVPPGADLTAFLESAKATVEAEIRYKEAQWAALTPKTREIEDPITGYKSTVAIDKSEIVRPEMPDYYAKRRNEYPMLGAQLDALWKGGQDMSAMAAKVQAIKTKYPKHPWL